LFIFGYRGSDKYVNVDRHRKMLMLRTGYRPSQIF